MEFRLTPPDAFDDLDRKLAEVPSRLDDMAERSVVRIQAELADDFEAEGPFSSLGNTRRVFRPDSEEGNLWIGTWTVPPDYLKRVPGAWRQAVTRTPGFEEARLYPVHEAVSRTVEQLIADLGNTAADIWEDEFDDAFDFDNP